MPQAFSKAHAPLVLSLGLTNISNIIYYITQQETPEYSDSPDILEPTILDPVVTPETEDAEFLEPEQAEALPKSDAQIEPTEPSEPIPEVCHQEELVVNHEKEKVKGGVAPSNDESFVDRASY